MGYIARQGEHGDHNSNSGPRLRCFERVPRGQCQPPIAPAPDPKRGEAIIHKDADAQSDNQSRRRRSSQLVVVSQVGESALRKPTPRWKRGYVGFKRKVKSSALMPALLVVSLCGAGAPIVGLTGVSSGFFTWSVGCEGVVTVTGDSERANGVQTYSLGWVRYNGKGPSTASDSPTLPVDSSNDNNNGTVGSDLGYGGVAGSSVPEDDWLAKVDDLSAVFGVLGAVGHFISFVFFSSALFTAQQLFRSQFESDRCPFRLAWRGAMSLLMWMVGFGGVGFYLSARKGFTAAVLSTLHSEGFLCEDESTFSGDFSFVIATGAGSVACALMVLFTWWFGGAADLALAENFKRRRASCAAVGCP